MKQKNFHTLNFQTSGFGTIKQKYGLQEKKGNAIGRSFYVHPNSGELYYLTLLLNHKKGATSFQSLHTHNDLIYPTYQAMCHASGLLGDDREWNEEIIEA